MARLHKWYIRSPYSAEAEAVPVFEGTKVPEGATVKEGSREAMDIDATRHRIMAKGKVSH